MTIVSASCHCGAVRFEVEEPEWVLDCNCSHCRLYGGLWAYYPQRDVRFASPPDTFIYMWGDRELEFHHCRTCGCATHSTQVGTNDAEKIAVNARLMRGLDPKRVRYKRTMAMMVCSGHIPTHLSFPVTMHPATRSDVK